VSAQIRIDQTLAHFLDGIEQCGIGHPFRISPACEPFGLENAQFFPRAKV
jgi:hypothetical protein